MTLVSLYIRIDSHSSKRSPGTVRTINQLSLDRLALMASTTTSPLHLPITPLGPNRSLFTASPTTHRLGKLYQTPSAQSPIPKLSFTSPPNTTSAAIRLPFSPCELDDSPTTIALSRRIFSQGLMLAPSQILGARGAGMLYFYPLSSY